MSNHRAIFALAILIAFTLGSLRAQFGGRDGDAVLYLLTSKGSGDIHVVPSNTVNPPELGATFRVVDVDTVPPVDSDPFPLTRRVLFDEPDELFQKGLDEETTVGVERVFIIPVKLFLLGGVNLLPGGDFGIFLSGAANYVTIPPGLAVKGDIALEDIVVLTWSPRHWPFMELTDQPGPVATGFEHLFLTPGLIRLPAFMPWTAMRLASPDPSWRHGVDVKLVDRDLESGNTTRLLRLRPGARTPFFRLEGRTHLYVLQGHIELTPAGAGTIQMPDDHYAHVPDGFAVRIANPRPYDGPLP